MELNFSQGRGKYVRPHPGPTAIDLRTPIRLVGVVSGMKLAWGLISRIGEFWHPCRGAIRSARDPGGIATLPPGYFLETLRVA
jgi:hypothetical protein